MNNSIELKSLSKSYGRRQVLKNVDLIVKKDRIHGLLGPNGAGKTTVMKSIIGLIQGESGEIIFNGSPISSNKKRSLSLGYLLEDPPLYEDMYVEEYLRFMGNIQGVHKNKLNERVEFVLGKLDLSDVMARRIGNLSQGYRQRLGIAQAIIHDPEVVILDEPTNGLDPKTIVEIRDLILSLKENHTILISSHQLHEMSLICDDITIVSNGDVLKSGDLSEISKDLNKSNHLTIELKEKNDELERYLESLKEVKTVDKQSGDTMTYVVTLLSDRDLRPEIAKKTIEFNCHLLSFFETKTSLEDLFLNLTEDQK